MSLVIVETQTEQPITDEILQENDEQALPCLTARNAEWRYSLLSTDRCRMICTFHAPDLEAVQSAYRTANVSFSKMWSAQIYLPDEAIPQREEQLKVIEGTYPPITEDERNTIHAQLLPYYAAAGVEWICSYISLARTRTICELNSPDAEAIYKAYRRFNIAFDRVWSAYLLKP